MRPHFLQQGHISSCKAITLNSDTPYGIRLITYGSREGIPIQVMTHIKSEGRRLSWSHKELKGGRGNQTKIHFLEKGNFQRVNQIVLM